MNPTVIDTDKELERLEGVIRKNLTAFYEVGQALMAIRDKRLYLCKNGGEYQTFEAYCQGVWDMSRIHAWRLMEATETRENLLPIGNMPVTESQARPLSKLEPEQQRQAWQKAVETAPEGKVTAAHVARVVKGMTEPEEINGVSPATVKRAGKFAGAVDEVKTQNPDLTDTKKIYQLAKEKTKGMGSVAKKTIPGPGSAIRFAEIAISQLDRIRDGDPETEDALCMVQEWIDNKRKQRS